MASHRDLRMAEAIREVVATTILFETSDPRVRGVTVLGVAMSPDLRHAKVSVSITGTEKQRRLAFSGLRSAAGYLQAKVAARLQTRFTPRLAFELDDGIRRSIAISKLIDEAIASDRGLDDSTDQDTAEYAAEEDIPVAAADHDPGPAQTLLAADDD